MPNGCGWKALDSFESFADYERMRTSINDQIKAGEAEERRVGKPYSGLDTLNEHWYRCRATGQTWRLIAPDPPFQGIFQKV
jgi:hypothetical protein